MRGRADGYFTGVVNAGLLEKVTFEKRFAGPENRLRGYLGEVLSRQEKPRVQMH